MNISSIINNKFVKCGVVLALTSSVTPIVIAKLLKEEQVSNTMLASQSVTSIQSDSPEQNNIEDLNQQIADLSNEESEIEEKILELKSSLQRKKIKKSDADSEWNYYGKKVAELQSNIVRYNWKISQHEKYTNKIQELLSDETIHSDDKKGIEESIKQYEDLIKEIKTKVKNTNPRVTKNMWELNRYQLISIRASATVEDKKERIKTQETKLEHVKSKKDEIIQKISSDQNQLITETK